MLSVIILADAGFARLGDTERLRTTVKTLAALVPLVVADFIADAAIVTRSDVTLKGLEDSAGCRIFADDNLGAALVRASKAARRDHLFVLSPGYAPDAAFAGEIEQMIESSAGNPLALLEAPRTFAQRLMPDRAPAVGIIARRSSLTALSVRRDVTLPALKRVLAASPMRGRALRL